MGAGPRRVVVLGGGSAGWLTAGTLAAGLGPAVQVTVIESPDIPAIGVGEGTWPTMRDTLAEMGVSESAFVRECDAAFKQGSLFRGWREDPGGPAGAADAYFHPFMLPHGYLEAPLARAWQAAQEEAQEEAQEKAQAPGRAAPPPFAEACGVQAALCQHGRAPKQATTPEFAAVANYGYHFDAGRLGPFLRSHAVQRLGVRHVADEMVDVVSHEHGDIRALATRAHGPIEGDLFIDCSGLRARLLHGHFGVPLVPVRGTLFCDAALALQVPYGSESDPVATHTVGTAQAHGWVWDIGLQSRRGIGIVYSSAHTDAEGAERALRAYVAAETGTPAEALPAARALRFEPGYRAAPWHRNCVAVGLAAGFVEPLEASSLALVEFAAHFLREQLPPTRALMDDAAARFNAASTHRWGRIVDFLKLHYLLSRRADSEFWRDHRAPASVPATLAAMLQRWRAWPPSRHDFERHDEPFPSASWQYVLYGMGFRADLAPPLPPAQAAQAHARFEEAQALRRRMLPALPPHRALLQHVARQGLHRV